MNRALVDPIARAVLYEGYILYPYRPSIKNRQRWTFGGLYPAAYCAARGSDAPGNRTECLVQGGPGTDFEAVVRFLHVTSRTAGELLSPRRDRPDDEEPPFRAVETLRVGDRLYHTWQEAEEREVALPETTLGVLCDHPLNHPFAFPGARRWEPIRGEGGEVVGVLVRERHAIEGVVEVAAVAVEEGLYRLSLRVANQTLWQDDGPGHREAAALRALVSTHSILGVRDGAFPSLMDPPERYRLAASACRNEGTWPVLVGGTGQAELMLSSPIILYDDPEIAPESPGEFFDGTEIDEMLTLRVLTMTDEEQGAMAAVDERTRALLERVRGMGPDARGALHGTWRGLRSIDVEGPR